MKSNIFMINMDILEMIGLKIDYTIIPPKVCTILVKFINLMNDRYAYQLCINTDKELKSNLLFEDFVLLNDQFTKYKVTERQFVYKDDMYFLEHERDADGNVIGFIISKGKSNNVNKKYEVVNLGD